MGRVSLQSAALDSNISTERLRLADDLRKAGLLSVSFNPGFLTGPDASDLRPEAAGLGIAILGSAYMMILVLVLALPTIIIATRALKAVPPSIRDAVLGVGASRMQAIFHHVLPLAMPGILTGAIIGLAQALGETAPLLLIGMVAFVKEYPDAPPEGFFDAASALPVQVYNFTTRGDPAFVERASGAIIVLLAFLITMNAAAIRRRRRRFERRW